MAWTTPWVLFFVLVVSGAVNAVLSSLSLLVIASVCERIQEPFRLLGAALLMPFYKGLLRWVRFRATVYEILRYRYDDGFLPLSSWAHATRW